MTSARCVATPSARRRTSARTTDNPYAAARRITSAVSRHVSTALPTELAPAANLAAYVGVQWLMRFSAQSELGSPHTHGLCELPRTPTRPVRPARVGTSLEEKHHDLGPVEHDCQHQGRPPIVSDLIHPRSTLEQQQR